MKISVISFSMAGFETGNLIGNRLKSDNEVSMYTKSKYTESTEASFVSESLNIWAEKAFKSSDALIFIGALGIAVRAIAPYVKSKKTDPAVVVLDEKGKFVIALLSGHLGGANELTGIISEITGGIPVITTATDINEKFAVDVFAKKNRCHISDMTLAKEISAAVVDGRKVKFSSNFPVEGSIPDELKGTEGTGVRVTVYPSHYSEENETLFLIPEIVTAGIGCRKNTERETIEKVFDDACNASGISAEAVKKICSIDLKKDEKGLVEFAENLNVPFETFTKEELEKVPGEFTESEFVKKVTGVSNVCERSALAGSNGEIIFRKYAWDGVTVSFAIEKWSVRF